jgi:hypothetical protein
MKLQVAMLAVISSSVSLSWYRMVSGYVDSMPVATLTYVVHAR